LGRTVDLVSYTVQSLQPSPSVKEAASGSGDLCGSSFLNRIFSKYLEDRMHSNRNWNDDYLEDAIRFFEEDIKPKFTGDDEIRYIRVRGLPDNPIYGIRNKRVEISGRDLRERVFKPVIQEIQTLVQKQIDATIEGGARVKAVLLAGGFGRNAYLKMKLQETVGEHIKVRLVEER
jgi:hypothetical protein